MPSIQGRGLPAPTTEVALSCKGASIRVDDDLNPEVWFEIFIPWEELSKWQQQQREHDEFEALLPLCWVPEQGELIPPFIPEVPDLPGADRRQDPPIAFNAEN